MGIRRVVTGHAANGRSIVAGDEVVEPYCSPLTPGLEFFRLWGADAPPALPNDGSMPAHHAYFPPVGGFRFGLFTVPPATEVQLAGRDVGALLAEMEANLPGLAADMEPGHPGMHTTASVDYEFVVSGSVVLELDDGVEVELHPGDTVVQNGTRHAWHNRGTEPCRMVVVLVGAPHAAVG